ncbi:MAG: CHAT domain-containing protein [Gemmatimonadota bacterium]|nr:CHAT domain-containing protein [Gemmatimonadota bacterium]
MLAELARASELPRTLAPRLSIPVEFRACTLSTPPEGTIPQATCEAPSDPILPSRRILDLAARASAAVHARVDPEALHTAALIDLVWGGASGASLERSISYLQTASRLSSRPAPVLADLAAAYLVRAEANQTPRDLLEAVEAAAQALERQPRNGTARFNLALALDRLGLEGQTARAWREFLAMDSTSKWADEARLRLRAAASVPPPPAPAANASAAELAAYAARAPQEARLRGWDELLGEWGAAVLSGDSARAADQLSRAEVIASSLEKAGGDATLADAVRAIRSSVDNAKSLRTLAQAHQMYAAGRAAFGNGNSDAAGRFFRGTLERAEGSPALRQWAQLFSGGALMQGGRTEEAERVFRQVITQADTIRYPAIAAQSRWARGTALLRSGRYEEALALLPGAASSFARIGEREHVGTIQVLTANAEQNLGDHSVVHRSMHRALATLRPHRQSVWLHNLLYLWAQTASRDGYARAAIRVQDEGVAVASSTASPVEAPVARLARARLLTIAGDTVAATRDIEASRELIERMPPSTTRGVRADYWLAKANVAVSRNPAYAETALDSVVDFFGEIANPARLLPALVARAEARLATGQIEHAEADLARAMTLIDEQQAATSTASLRASLLEAARRTVDRLVMLRVTAGNPSEALAYLERGRASFSPTTGRQSPTSARLVASPPGQVVVEYALIGDTLLAWTLAGTSMQLARTTIDRRHLTGTSDRVRSALELRAAESTLRPDLALLYDWLIRPIQSRLGPDGTQLVLVADGELAGIPFAALHDKTRAQYLVEKHPLRFANSLRDVAQRPGAEASRPRAVLLVSDPAFDPSTYPGLKRLAGAGTEVGAIAAQYTRARVLGGADAIRTRFEGALRQAHLVHYAGHAIFDDQDPRQSHLVLAAHDGDIRAARLTAGDIEQLDLRSVNLVVLSACQTAGAGAGRAGGFIGLTGALLGAGAGGVVGSLWRIDDGLTHPLMIEFHRAYRTSSDAAASLRAAQLRMLRSPDVTHRNPAAWAGFRYTGA